jgi:uncharacterized protein
MKLGGRERADDGALLEDLFRHLPVTADWTIGLLTAVCTGPDAVSPTVWLPEIIPEGAFDDTPAARAKVDLLARLHGAVSETLRTTPEIICPEPDKPAEEAVNFCRGYVHGARMHAKWRDDEAARERLVPFEQLANPTPDTEPATSPHRERLGRHVAELHAYWQSKRQVVHATPKVGRNDPCPCGSGKKHKKCCLARLA